MKLFHSVEEMIGHTPLLDIARYRKQQGITASLLAKVEGMNPAGSAKDRVGAAMIADAEQRGLLKPDSVIIEPTSGNTGIGLAAVAAMKGYRVILTMPDSMSVERRRLLAAYGAEIVLTPAAEGMAGSVAEAKRLAAQYSNSFIPDQFGNPANVAAHYRTTGPEIFEDTDGGVDIFVAGIGTGGTVSGVGQYLKEQKPSVRIVGVEPADSPVLTVGEHAAAPHRLQGMGANFVPAILNRDVIDEIMTVTTEQAYAAGRSLAHSEGVLCGVSSGAALYAATELAKRPENADKQIVVLLPDTGDRYLSVEGYLL